MKTREFYTKLHDELLKRVGITPDKYEREDSLTTILEDIESDKDEQKTYKRVLKAVYGCEITGPVYGSAKALVIGPKKFRNLEENIELSHEELAYIKELLSMTGNQIYDKYGLHRDETICHTAKFSDGVEADIKLVICEDDYTPYTEAVLYKNGCELMCTTPEDEYEGVWELESDDTKYVVVVREEGSNV